MNNINDLQSLESINLLSSKFEIFDEKILNDESECAWTFICFTFSC